METDMLVREMTPDEKQLASIKVKITPVKRNGNHVECNVELIMGNELKANLEGGSGNDKF